MKSIGSVYSDTPEGISKYSVLAKLSLLYDVALLTVPFMSMIYTPVITASAMANV